jgi:hypothetical protein
MVVIGKIRSVEPAGTVTVAGTPTRFGYCDERFTTKPPLGAGTFRYRCPVTPVPPTTVVGVRESRVTCADTTVMVVCFADAASDATINTA